MSAAMYRSMLLAVVLYPMAATAVLADDLKISQLEQDVRELQRLVQQQTRRIDALESAARLSRTTRSTGGDIPEVTRTPTLGPTPAAWLQNANWDKVRVGMPQAEVLKLLGPPTTTRVADNAVRTLFYTLELEAGGFLSGRVLMSEERVLEIHKPALR